MAEPRSYGYHLHYHPDAPADERWSPDPSGASFRLEAHIRVREVPDIVNRIRPADGRGGWGAPVIDEKLLTPEQRGLIWYGWKTLAAGKDFFAFKGVRVIDDVILATYLDGVRVYDERTGAPCADPRALGHIFMLDEQGARVFNERVKQQGGTIYRGDPLPADARQALTALEADSAELERLSQQDAAAIDEARSGNFVAQPAFERRHEQFRERVQRAQTAMEHCERACQGLLSAGKSMAERAEAEELLARARQAFARSQALFERRETDEREFGRVVARASGRMPDDLPVASRLLYFRELGRLASADGLTVEDTPDGCRILTDQGWLRLPGFTFDAQ